MNKKIENHEKGGEKTSREDRAANHRENNKNQENVEVNYGKNCPCGHTG